MKALEQEGAIEFLILLYQKEKLNVSEALKTLSVGQSALYTALKKLSNSSLITETKGEGFPFPRFFILTDKGREVATHLNEIKRVMSKEK